jgi:hypothetical protein
MGKLFSMRKRAEERQEEETPGPGGYEIKSKAIEGKSVFISGILLIN